MMVLSSPATHSKPVQPMAQAPQRSVSSNELLAGGKSVEITHNGAVYRLQATKLGKLILTK
jgi:hemin uptake protein HemP